MKTNKKKWYQEPIMLLVVGLPILVVIFSIITISIFVEHQPSLVSEDYYRDGKSINQRLDLIENAQNLALYSQHLLKMAI